MVDLSIVMLVYQRVVFFDPVARLPWHQLHKVLGSNDFPVTEDPTLFRRPLRRPATNQDPPSEKELKSLQTNNTHSYIYNIHT
jgi:hypothetical protein